MNNIEELQDVVRKLHGTEATHVETVPVKETFQGQTVWEGHVEVFDIDHPQTSRITLGRTIQTIQAILDAM